MLVSTSTCSAPECDDGVIQRGNCEQETGNTLPCNGPNNRCLPTCLWNVCGDDNLCLAINCGTGDSAAEQCDDGEANADSARCSASCMANRCGDGDQCTDDNCDEPFVTEQPRCSDDCDPDDEGTAYEPGDVAANGRCEDGGPGSASGLCPIGTDCSEDGEADSRRNSTSSASSRVKVGEST